MNEQLERRIRDLSRRAGLSGIAPTAVAVGCAVLGVAVLLAAWRFWPRSDTAAATFAPGAGVSASSASSAATPSVEATDPPHVYVHVIGAVERPGVYDLETGARVIDAVTAAGGLKPEAGAAGVNLARVLSDGEQIAVPTKEQLAKGEAVPGAAGTGGVGASGPAQGGKVNINTADAAMLDTLPGVGPSTAQKIIADREANGPFAAVEDLGRVSGIGPKKLDGLKDLISAN